MINTMKSRRVACAVLTASLAIPAVALGQGSVRSDEGRMTGGGTFLRSTGLKVSHGFTLRCPATKGPNRLEINWGKGNKFHLKDMTFILCTDGARYDEGQPRAGFDTYRGEGTGRYNGRSGATVRFKFIDDGEPGTSDRGRIEVTDATGKVVLRVTERRLNKGNHQAHRGN